MALRAFTPRIIRAQPTPVTVAAGGSLEVTITWPAEITGDYSPLADVEQGETAATGTLRLRRIRTRTSTEITVIVENADALLPRSGTLHAIAVT